MTTGKKPHPTSTRLMIRLEREHEAHLDLIAELEPYCRANPDDKWAAGQLRYSRKHAKRLEKKLGLATNRGERPTE